MILAKLNLLNILTHPFMPEGFLALFVLTQTALCIQKKKNRTWLHRIGSMTLGLLLAYALYAHIFVDLRYYRVMQNNHIAQALHYRIASLWSHHETSLFIWLVILNLTSSIIRIPHDSDAFRRRILALFNCLFCLYLMTEANPFATTPIEQLNQQSQGLNPLLYDLNMVWHPPLLYLGVTWLFTPYVLGLWYYRMGNHTALVDHTVLYTIQQHTKIAFGLLTVAIALGSLWAFTQLGWGGFWFWDPVETASLLPWIAALIVFHVKANTLKQHIWIGCIPFALVILSLWAVRSGMLMSVHSFANDVMAFWVLGGIAVFTYIPLLIMILMPKQQSSNESKQFKYHYTTYLRLGMWLLALTLILLSVALFVPVVFNFTLSPLFFNTILRPIWIIIALLMAVAPLKKLRFNTSSTSALFAVVLYLTFYAQLAIPDILLGASGSIVVGAMLPMLLVKPGVALTHIGVGLSLIGFASHSYSPAEVTLTLTKSVPLIYKSHTRATYPIIFEDVSEIVETFKSTQYAHILIKASQNDNASALTLNPARQFFHSSQLQRVKADFGMLNHRILMITNIEIMSNGRIAITIHEKFGLIWLVFGCALIVTGIFISPMLNFLRRRQIITP